MQTPVVNGTQFPDQIFRFRLRARNISNDNRHVSFSHKTAPLTYNNSSCQTLTLHMSTELSQTPITCRHEQTNLPETKKIPTPIFKLQFSTFNLQPHGVITINSYITSNFTPEETRLSAQSIAKHWLTVKNRE